MGDPDQVAAWGDPPLTLRCGVSRPDREQTPLILNGLPFVTERRPGRVLWSTNDRAVVVELDIPLDYDSQADVVLPLVPALAGLPAAPAG